MSTTAPPPPKKPPRAKKAKLKGAGAIAQGTKAKAAGKRGVVVDGPVRGNITTGDTTYQTIIHQAAEPGASADDLRRAYLARVSARANELPLLAGESGAPVQLSSVYTALLTEGPDASEAHMYAAGRAARAMADRDAARASALEVLDKDQYLVLMGGPAAARPRF
jgi:hypothetical protein